MVAYEEGHKVVLKKEILLGDALSDLPPVENNEKRDEMPYNGEPETAVLRFIRLKKEVMLGSTGGNLRGLNEVLYDHRPLQLNKPDGQTPHSNKRRAADPTSGSRADPEGRRSVQRVAGPPPGRGLVTGPQAHQLQMVPADLQQSSGPKTIPGPRTPLLWQVTGHHSRGSLVITPVGRWSPLRQAAGPATAQLVH